MTDAPPPPPEAEVDPYEGKLLAVLAFIPHTGRCEHWYRVPGMAVEFASGKPCTCGRDKAILALQAHYVEAHADE